MLNAEQHNEHDQGAGNGYQLDSVTREIAPSNNNRSSLATKIGVGVLAVGGFLGLSGEAKADQVIDIHNPNAIAQNNETRERAVVAAANRAWEGVQPAVEGKTLSAEQKTQIAIHWNELKSHLMVSDDTAISGIEPIRNAIIDQGATNSNIPADVVEAALYSGGVLAGELNRRTDILETRIEQREDAIEQLEDILERQDQFDQQFLTNVRASITRLEGEINNLESTIESLQERIDAVPDAAMRFFGKNIVDIEDSRGNVERRLLSVDEAKKIAARPGVTVYEGTNFENLASFVVARSENTEILHQALEQLQSETDPARRDRLMRIFETIPASDIPGGMIEQSNRWVFGNNGASSGVFGHSGNFVNPGTNQTRPASQFTNVNKEALENLKDLEGRLVSPALPNLADLDPQQKEFIARNILILAKTNQSQALCASAQWFAQMDPEKVLENRPTVADFLVLEALAIAAEKSDVGYEVLERVVASNPALTLDFTMIGGLEASPNHPQARAAAAMTAAFRAHREESQELLLNIADRKAPLLWKELDAGNLRELQEHGRDSAIVNMILLGTEKEFNGYYKSLVNNRFASDRELQLGITGLALSRDESALGDILDIAVDATRSLPIRNLAFEAALFIDTTDPLPAAAKKMAQEQLPYAVDGLGRYLPNYDQHGKRLTSDEVVASVKDVKTFNPFEYRMIDIYQEAVAHQKRFTGTDPELTKEQRYELLQRSRELTLAGSRGVFTSATQNDPEFRQKYINPMLRYLEQHADRNRPIDTGLAVNMLSIIRKVDAPYAAERMLDIYRNTTNYTHNEDLLRQGGWAAMTNANNEVMLKAASLETLGSSIDLLNLEDASARVLHIAAERESYPGYRAAARAGLLTLASRYEDALEQTEDADERSKLQAAQRHHGALVVEHMLHQNKGLDGETQVRLSNHRITHAYAGIALEFGAAQELMQEVDRIYLDNPKMLEVNGTPGHRPELVRSIVNAMLQKGYDVEDVRALSSDATIQRRYEDVFSFVADQRFWANQETSIENDGQGINLFVNDVGSVYGDVLGRDVKFFSKAFDANRYVRGADSHPTGVAGTTLHHAPNVDNVYSVDVAASIYIDDYRPETYNDPLVLGRELMVEMMIMDQIDTVVSNQSIGYANAAMMYESVRSVLNQFAAFQMTAQAISNADRSVQSIVVSAAGNSGGGSPFRERYGVLGEVNVMGHFILDDGTVVAVPNTFTASALDSWSKRGPASFSSRFPVTNETTPFTMHGTPGASVPFYWQENGEWTLVQGNGTSFASPNLAGKMIEVLEELAEHNVTATPEELSRIMLNSTRLLPDHNAAEGGLEVIDRLLWENVQRFVAEKTGE